MLKPEFKLEIVKDSDEDFLIKALDQILAATYNVNVASDSGQYIHLSNGDSAYGTLKDAFMEIAENLFGYEIGKAVWELCVDNGSDVRYNVTENADLIWGK